MQRGFYKLKPKDKEILMIVAEYPQGLFLSQIQKYAKITSLQNAYAYATKLTKAGYLTRENKLYKTTGKHLSELKGFSYANRNTLVDTPQKLTTRAHKLGISYPLMEQLEPTEPQKLFQMPGREPMQITLKNNTQAILKIGSITAKLTTKHLELYSKDIYTDNRSLSIELEDAIKREFDAVASEIEQRCNLKLKRIKRGVFETSITAQHYAEENHPFAEQAPDSPMILARSPIDAQRRLGIDKSKGFREWEYYHRLSAGTDKDTGDSQFNGVLDGKINLWDINFLKEHMIKQDNLLQGYARQIEIHLKVMNKIDRKLSQRTLREEHEG